MKRLLSITFSLLMVSSYVFGQTDTTYTEEEDYSIYDNLEFADEGTKRFASVKVSGKSPDKLISVGYDWQGAYDSDAAALGLSPAENADITATHGFRFETNVPVISKNNIIIQAGLLYWNTIYEFENENQLVNPLHRTLADNGLNTIELSSTIYKPLNETSFLLFQLRGGMSGDYSMEELQNTKYNRYALAAIWGKKPNDRKQWGLGLSRTYRAGELNYIPVVLYNWTSVDRKWGVETVFPARGDVRYNFNPRSMLFFGFDLEGNSYRIGNQGTALAEPLNDLEIRRSELRFRFRYERQLTGFIWISAKVGYRYNYSFNVDQVADGEDFFRGFFGDQEYAMENELTNPLFFNFSINLVSP